MEKDLHLETQYNTIAETFSQEHKEKNQINRTKMYECIDSDLRNQKVLDLGCGDGFDANHYHSLGAKVTGIDASASLLSLAKEEYPHIQFIEARAEKLPFPKESFDQVFSKYAIMTSADMEPIFSEIHRVLKPGGTMIILCTHPFRQFMEKQQTYAQDVEETRDYFTQQIVECKILDNTVTVFEPSHTLEEYFSSGVLKKFEIQRFTESFDPAADRIGSAKYPGFFIIKAQKRKELREISFFELLKAKINGGTVNSIKKILGK